MNFKRISAFQLVLMVLGSLVLLFIIAPLLGLVLDTKSAQLFETAADTEVQDSIFLTLWVSLVTTFVFAFFSIPLAWVLARKQFKLNRLIRGIIDLPIVIPHSAAGIAVLGLVSRDTLLGQLGDQLGIRFVGSPLGIGLAMAFVSVPFLINAARDGFESVPERLEKAALNLGASPLRVFFTISAPLAWRHIVSGLVMMFARGMSEFGAVVIVAYHPIITPVLIYERFGAFGLDYARPVALIFILVCLVFFLLLRLLSPKVRA